MKIKQQKTTVLILLSLLMMAFMPAEEKANQTAVYQHRYQRTQSERTG
jgi:hypothetical protein